VTTLAGPWIGSGTVKARLLCGYTRSYNAEHTVANFSGTLYIEFNYSVWDSTNSWAMSGDGGSKSGSNMDISLNSGGQVAFATFACSEARDASIAGSVASINAVGATVSETFSLDAGPLAPFMNNSNYVAINIGPNQFDTSGLSGSGNGSALTNTQLEYNTVASESGATLITAGSYTNIARIGGLKRATLYYFRMRVANAAYGWGAWGAWKSFTTLSTVPGEPDVGWTMGAINQTSLDIVGNHVSDDGGLLITDWDVQYNLTADATGATTVTTSSATLAGPVTGLIPGTEYFMRLRAKNSLGWGPYSAWKSSTTLPGVFVRVAGVWVNAVPYIKANDVWVPAVRYVKVGGVWKQ